MSWGSRLLFTDLHVGAKTLTRALALLARVRELAKHNQDDVICLGDFWDLRGSLSVRQLDEVMNEFERWQSDGVKLDIIPGNHDQVSMDGAIHAVRVFSHFQDIRVHTEMHLDHARRLAYLPWREQHGEQAEMLRAVPDGYTVFAHAEIQGATTNSSHEAAGRVSLQDISRMRAFYAGHYHKRQKLGDRAWYIGSPFEMNYGERDQPHGIAVVHDTTIEPEFMNLDEFPKHVFLRYPESVETWGQQRAQDIITVQAPSLSFGTPEFRSALDVLPSRPATIPDPIEKDAYTVEAVTDLASAVPEYVDEEIRRTGLILTPVEREAYINVGLTYLAEVADKSVVTPAASFVEPMRLTIKDFCAVSGTVMIDLARQGAVLLRGPMGVGKTSIYDALAWALFGVTTPRKPGSAKASLKADDIIHDDAQDTAVTIELMVGDQLVTIKRSKKRGKSATIEIQGSPTREGITDQQELIHHLVGLDYNLWRTCVSLGQGAVANFVTDAGTARADLFMRAFRLTSCTYALAKVKDERKSVQAKLADVQMALTRASSAHAAIKGTDFAEDERRWAAQNKIEFDAAMAHVEQLRALVAGYDEHLATKPQWEETRQACQAYVSRYEEQLAKSSRKVEVGKAHQDLGTARTNAALLQSELTRDRTKLAQMIQASNAGVMQCPECGQTMPMTHFEQRIDELEVKITNLTQQVSVENQRVSNLTIHLGELTSADGDDREVMAALQDGRDKLEKCNHGLNALTDIAHKRAAAVRDWEATLATIEKLRHAVNPFTSKQTETKAKLELLEVEMRTLAVSEKTATEAVALMSFWEDGFGSKGLPVLVMLSAINELQQHANRFLATLLGGRLACELEMKSDALHIRYFEQRGPTRIERSYEQLSGGLRRCVELAFVPFALSETVFSRAGVRIPLLLIDELTTHLDAETKPLLCGILTRLGRSSVFVIDHDETVRGEFDVIYDVVPSPHGTKVERSK